MLVFAQDRQHRIVNRGVGLGEQGRANGLGGRAGVMREQRRAPAPRQDPVGYQEARQVDQLPDVVVRAEAVAAIVDHGLRIAPRQLARPTDAQVVAAVLGQRRDDRAVAEQCLDQELLVGVRRVVLAHVLAHPGVVDVVQSADVERGVRPGGEGDRLDHLCDPRPALDQQHVTDPDLVAQAFEIAGRHVVPRRFMVQPCRHATPDRAAQSHHVASAVPGPEYTQRVRCRGL